jgi:enterochelin esterase-like enzyme
VTQQLAAWEQKKAAALASKDMAEEARASRRIVQLQRSMTEAQKAADAGNQPSHGSDAWQSQLSVVTQEQAKLQAEIERYKWLGDRLIEGR